MLALSNTRCQVSYLAPGQPFGFTGEDNTCQAELGQAATSVMPKDLVFSEAGFI